MLIPSRGGVFEVQVDGTMVHSKKASGKHADYDQVLRGIRELPT
jgi:selenoprotein W-related protein